MKTGRWLAAALLAVVALVLAGVPAGAAGGFPLADGHAIQGDANYAASFAARGVTTVTATAQRTSCYTPEVPFFTTNGAAGGYPDGGMSPCVAADTGEDPGPYPTQAGSAPGYPAARPMRVKDHSESDLRVDPTNPDHLIGQSKWFVSAEGYNHLLGFFESFDGGRTWPVQGHVPGYEGWTDNTDPVGAFDPWGNFYSLILPYQFYYTNSGGHKFDNGSNQVNPGVPAEAVAVAVHPARTLPGSTPAASWITTHAGHPDYVMTARNANTSDPDKQWLTVDTDPASPHYGRVYAMWTLFVLNPSVIFEAHADARPDGTHTDWSAPQVLPTVAGKRWDSYLLPHVDPDGTVWTTTTNNPSQQGFSTAAISLIWSRDGGATWQGPRPVVPDVRVPTYRNTTFREGIVNTFAVGPVKVRGAYPLYVAWEDGREGLTNIYLTASYDGGRTWTAPIKVNDNAAPVDELQPNLAAMADGTVAVAFYDRRLTCPAQGTAEAAGAGLAYDPGTAAAPGTPYGGANYCVNTSIQFYTPALAPKGQNIRLSAHTWDPQLNAPHPGCPACGGTFIGDYFGVAGGGAHAFTASVSTFNDGGANPGFHQQQVVARVAIP